jgi:hypothetical protein
MVIGDLRRRARRGGGPGWRTTMLASADDIGLL